MKEIRLSGANPDGICALVSDEDFERLSRYRWYVHRAKGSLTIYAKSQSRPTLYMHREVMRADAGQIVDHADGDGLNNQRENLRFVTQSENIQSGYNRRFMERVAKVFDEHEHLL